MATATFKDLHTQITETLGALRFAREIGAQESITINERRLDYLLDKLTPGSN